jgi:hypothetical protein
VDERDERYGPHKLKTNRGAAGPSFVVNPTYWGGKSAIDAIEYQILGIRRV